MDFRKHCEHQWRRVLSHSWQSRGLYLFQNSRAFVQTPFLRGPVLDVIAEQIDGGLRWTRLSSSAHCGLETGT